MGQTGGSAKALPVPLPGLRQLWLVDNDKESRDY
jgi:hypothetical protein